ncbi:hypothetical protein [Paenibacillus eucommiae]|uniref:Gas vesicle protein GvpG n=1 Tax=Paenibacillus eucommiae TaxID=1355755 RepID=A0ABS4J3U1_9BACL|nr:hypothetical protein [Paenibacillus eucommiae]MBP1993886.1 hypothetical protein [Paenibacillus eucommiae]
MLNTSILQEKVTAMLLYKLTQQMEERSALQQALRSGDEGSDLLQAKIQQLEAELHTQAEYWKNSIEQPIAFEQPYEAPYLDEEISF